MNFIESYFSRLKANNVPGIVSLPFYDTQNDQEIFLPLNLLLLAVGSPGMAAGNTNVEAIFQAICEIMERWGAAEVFYNQMTPTEKEVRDALIKANAWEFIKKMKDKEKTLVGERGNSLSVGQKQRIAIARALIKDADILILDEATSNVDNILAKMIADAIDDISQQKIIFIIAHNLDSVATCDKIIYIKNGMISEQGSHKEHLAKQGDYAGQYTNHIHPAKKPGMKVVTTLKQCLIFSIINRKRCFSLCSSNITITYCIPFIFYSKQQVCNFV